MATQPITCPYGDECEHTGDVSYLDSLRSTECPFTLIKLMARNVGYSRMAMTEFKKKYDVEPDSDLLEEAYICLQRAAMNFEEWRARNTGSAVAEAAAVDTGSG